LHNGNAVFAGGGRHDPNDPKCANYTQRASDFRLFKCAVKDDETLIDAIVERLYGKMKEFDGRRADRTVGLIVDRDATGGATLRAFLDEVLLDPCVRAGA
jgi:hypothetical protein